MESEGMQLHLYPGILSEVRLSSSLNAGHVFLLPTGARACHSLPQLRMEMDGWYNQNSAPPLPLFQKGYICVSRIEGRWYRTMIEDIYQYTCKVKILDFGGYALVPKEEIRQIRSNFMMLPFTAVECCLGNITFPDGQNGWSDDALQAMEEMCVNVPLFAVCDRYSRNNIAYVRLFKFHGDKTLFINRELVERNLARWSNLSTS